MLNTLRVAEDLAAHLPDSPERFQVAPLALNDGAEDVASDDLRRQRSGQGICRCEDPMWKS